MKVIIPEHIGDIKLIQYQKYIELKSREDLDEHGFNVRKLQIFTGLKPDQVKSINSTDYAELLSMIDLALDKEYEFKPTFFIEDVEFGFIPNLDKITAGEYIDITKYENDIQDFHKLMAIFFRPIKKKDSFDNYSIIDYKGTEQFSEVMKLMPMSAVNGALVFFYHLGNELLSYTQRFSNQEQAKEKKHQSISRSGDGTQPLMI